MSGPNATPVDSFPKHDTPLIPELITSERPENLDGYFDFVENILDKSFRDQALVHVALKTAKITSLEFNTNASDTGDRKRGGKDASTTSSSSSTTPKKTTFTVPNHFIFSPRLMIYRDGKTFGKFKVGTKVSVEDVVDCYQRVKIDTDGAVTMKLSAANLLSSGVSLDGLVQVNFLNDATKDELSVKASVERNAVCFSMLGSRDGAGTAALKADGDVHLFNLHLGCGVEHHWGTPAISGGATYSGSGDLMASGNNAGSYTDSAVLAAPEEDNSSGSTSSLYVGAGCFGKGWHMAGKIFRDDGDWTEAQIVLYQNIHKLASIAAVYKVNTQEGVAETTLGVSRRFTLWGHKLVTAAKFSTSGWLSVLTEINLDAFTRIGLVTRFQPGTAQRPTFGVIASLQSD